MPDASHRLIVRVGGRLFQAVTLTDRTLTIGRGPDNLLVLDSAKVAWHHAEVRLTPMGVLLTDLGGSGGTFVGDERLAPHRPRLLRPGDTFRLGPFEVALELEPDPAGGQTFPPGDALEAAIIPPGPVEEPLPKGLPGGGTSFNTGDIVGRDIVGRDAGGERPVTGDRSLPRGPTAGPRDGTLGPPGASVGVPQRTVPEDASEAFEALGASAGEEPPHPEPDDAAEVLGEPPARPRRGLPAEAAATWQERRFEAAMPRRCKSGRPTEVRCMVPLAGSQGLRRYLPAYTEAGDRIAREDVADSVFPVEVPAGSTALTFYLKVAASDFTPAEQVRRLVVPVSLDSGVCTFRLVAGAPVNDSLVLVELYQDAELTTPLSSLTLFADIVHPAVPVENLVQLASGEVGLALSAARTLAAGAQQTVNFIVNGDVISVAGAQGAIINIKSSIAQTTQQVGALPHGDEALRARLADLLTQLSAALAQAPADQADLLEAAEAVANLAHDVVEELQRPRVNRRALDQYAAALQGAAALLAGPLPAVPELAARLVAEARGLAG